MALAQNLWAQNAEALSAAFLRSGPRLSSQLVVMALEPYLAQGPKCVVDLGGGDAELAVLLAERGHRVTVLDMDPGMLQAAQRRLASCDSAVSSRVVLVQGRGRDLKSLAGGPFDLVCCHSVLMYEDDPDDLLGALVPATRLGGVLSILATQPQAGAMRAGLQQRWRDTIAMLSDPTQHDPCTLPSSECSRAQVLAVLEPLGMEELAWFGVGVFTDHAPVRDDANPGHVLAAEWLAGQQDPYRLTARCFHTVLRRKQD